MSQVARWFDEVRQAAPNILDVAAALGLEVRRNRFGPCPACGHEEPRHPPLTVRHGGGGWMCAHCKEYGDAVNLVAVVRCGTKRPTGNQWDAVRAVFAEHGWCVGDGNRDTWTPPPRRVAPVAPYPDHDQLLGLLGACRKIQTVPPVLDWCKSRGWNRPVPAAVLPDVYPWPTWWPFRGHPYRLVVSMVDATGTVRSLHGRATETPTEGRPKTTFPYNVRAGGLFFADPVVARPVLRGVKPAPDKLLVVEGVTDYLAACCYAQARPDLMIVGATSGGFAALADAAIPRSTRVFVATDHDSAGDRYAAEVYAALRGRDIRRVHPVRPERR